MKPISQCYKCQTNFFAFGHREYHNHKKFFVSKVLPLLSSKSFSPLSPLKLCPPQSSCWPQRESPLQYYTRSICYNAITNKRLHCHHSFTISKQWPCHIIVATFLHQQQKRHFFSHTSQMFSRVNELSSIDNCNNVHDERKNSQEIHL